MKTQNFQLTRSFLLITILVLVVFGIGSLLRITANPARATLYSIFALVMFGDAAVIAFCAWRLNQRTKFAFNLSAIVLALNAFLPIFDQFGLVDLLFVLLNLVTLTLLFTARKEFLAA